jgi:hypothetical protein
MEHGAGAAWSAGKMAPVSFSIRGTPPRAVCAARLATHARHVQPTAQPHRGKASTNPPPLLPSCTRGRKRHRP